MSLLLYSRHKIYSCQRTNIRVSFNVEQPLMLNIFRHHSSGRIFTCPSLPARTSRRLSETIRTCYSFPSQDFLFAIVFTKYVLILHSPITFVKYFFKCFYFFKLVQPSAWTIFPSFISLPKARLKAALEIPKTSLMISAGVESP